MKTWFNIFTFLLTISTKIMAQPLTDQAGARSWGCPGLSSTATDYWSVMNNQAALAECKIPGSAMYFNNQFAVSNLNYAAFVAALPVKYGVLGVSTGRFGYEKYNETRAGIAFAKTLGKQFSSGIQLNAFRTSYADNYDSKNLVNFEIGLKYSFERNISIGVHAFNPTRVKTSNELDQRMPTLLKIGILWNYKNKAILASEIVQDIDGNKLLRTGVEYQLIPDFYIRGGIMLPPARSSFGMGYKLKKFQFDIAVITHPQLPLCSHLSLSYSFETSK